jgi:protoporphyrinogen oxidase
MQELSTDWLEGRLIPAAIPNIIRGAFSNQAEKEVAFTRFRYPSRGGFFGFFKSLYDDIIVNYGQRTQEIDLNNKEIVFESGKKEHYGIIVSSIPLPELIANINDVPASVKEAAALLRNTKLLCVNMVVNRPNLAPYHWCYVYDEAIHSSRISFPSNLSSSVPIDSGTISLLQCEIFRRNDEKWDIEHLVQTTVKQIANIFRFDVKNDLQLVDYQVIPYAYVISDLNRKSAVEYIHTWLKQHDIYCIGTYGQWKYMWSDIAYYSGVEIAHEIKEQICLK